MRFPFFPMGLLVARLPFQRKSLSTFSGKIPLFLKLYNECGPLEKCEPLKCQRTQSG